MNYPLISEYVEAIKSAEDNFEELSYLRPVFGEDGLPVMTSGNFAVVFKMKDEQSGKFYAVKCFTKEQEGRAEAYREIAKELEKVSSPYILSIRYLDKELFVDTDQTSETEFPVLLMDWVEGKTLDKYLRENLDDKYALEMLAYRFCQLTQWLIPQPFAHGDLKPDNILVREDGTLVLVDYDGMYVPSMKGQKARELGSPDFRHPQRTIDDFDKHIDDFSAVSILLSLIAISKVSFLHENFYHEDNNMEDWYNNLKLMLNYLCEPNVMNETDWPSWVVGLKSDMLFSSIYDQFLISKTTQKFEIGNNPYLSLDNIALNQYKVGVKYFEIGKYQEAYTIFRLLAKDGNAYGYNGLGICFNHGYCGAYEDEILEDYHYSNDENLKHYKLASFCFDKAAEAGYSPAMCNQVLSSIHYGAPCIYNIINDKWKGDLNCQLMLGICYFYGWGDYDQKDFLLEGNPIKSYGILVELGNNDNKIAQSYLGRICYKEYRSAPHLHSFQDALYWFKKAAIQNDPIAQYYLAVCYEELDKKEAIYDDNGYSQSKYFEEIEKWYKKSARNGFWLAQLEMGERFWGWYNADTKNAKNLNQAINWFEKAAFQGYYYAYDRLANIYYELGMYRDLERCVHISESLNENYDAMFRNELVLEFKNYNIW